MSAQDYPTTAPYGLNGYHRKPQRCSYELAGDYAVIHATGGDVLVDADNLEPLLSYGRWYVRRDRQVIAVKSVRRKQTSYRMHRLVTRVSRGLFVDHINGDRLDNRRANLRIVTNIQNAMNQVRPLQNTSGYTGVTFSAERKRWVAQIKVDYKNLILGRFKDIEDAAMCRYAAATQLRGEYAAEVSRG